MTIMPSMFVREHILLIILIVVLKGVLRLRLLKGIYLLYLGMLLLIAIQKNKILLSFIRGLLVPQNFWK